MNKRIDNEQTILTLEVKKYKNEFYIDILENGYNIINKTMYNAEVAKKIIEIIEKEVKEK